MAVAEFLILEGGRLIRSVPAAAGCADFAGLDRLHTPSVLGGDRFLAEVPDGVRNAWAVRVFGLLRDPVAFIVVFGAGTSTAYDSGRVLVDGDGRSRSE